MPDIASYCSCPDLYWYGCYGSGAKYKQYTISEAVKHPAKMFWELLERIFKHLETMSLITQESVVIDFMAGTGRTNTMAALRGHRTISVELEPHFIKMIEGNKALLEKKFGGNADWDVIQGDARELSRLLDGKGLVGVISPPYTNQVAFQDKNFILSIAEDKSQRYRDGRLRGHFATPEAIKRYAEKIMETYSHDPRNIGNLPDKPLAAIISPPYCEAQTGGGIAIKGYCGPHVHEMGENQPDKVGQTCGYMKEVHGYSPENIGNLKDLPECSEGKETYLTAMHKCFQQAHICGISPLVVVTRNPTRNGTLRRLNEDMARLLELAGYEIFDYHRARLFHGYKQATLEGNSFKVAKGRVGFFKRDKYSKGTEIAQWEDVIFGRIP